MKDSLAASALVAGAMYLHKWTRIYEKNIHSFLCSTQFLIDQLKKGGIPGEKLRHVPLYLDLSRYDTRREQPEDYAVYVGRLVPGKGLELLVRAVSKVPQAKLVIVGEGEAREDLGGLAAECGGDVTFAGRQEGDALATLIARARFLVLPSEVYETCGLVLWEASALGRPTIASRIGGIPESVDEGVTGLLVDPGDVDRLAEKMAWMFEHPGEAGKMGEAGRSKVEALCASHYDKILAMYEEAIGNVPTRTAGQT